MNALEFAKERRRMCKTVECVDCPLANTRCQIGIADDISEDERIVEVVEKWGEEHPVKTRQSEFLKLHPHTVLDNDGIIRACVSDMECDFICNGNCVKCRKDYWLKEIE